MALVFTIALNGYHIRFRKCIDTQRAYAARIGADFAYINSPRVDDPAIAAWMKLTVMRRALLAGYTNVAYIDADCAVRAEAPTFINELDNDQAIRMAKGRSGRLNSGVIFARNTAGTREYVDFVLDSATSPIPEKHRIHLRFENGNIIYAAEKLGTVGDLDLRWNNTYDPDLPDYIRHYTGPLKTSVPVNFNDRVRYRLLQLALPRATKAPERREPAFVRDLMRATEIALDGPNIPRRLREHEG